MGQGAAADFAGSLLWTLLPKLPGRSREARVASLWAKMQRSRREHGVQGRLQSLTANMIKPPGQGAKLRCSAAQMRRLVPFLVELADELLSFDDPVEAAARTAAQALQKCYGALSGDADTEAACGAL